MQAENWKLVKELLQEVLPLNSTARQRFLDDSGIYGEIRHEIESLLDFETESEDLMRLSAVEFSRDFFDEEESAHTLIGQSVGAYRIIGELGSGGMGAVYLAERSDGKFEQKVALKLLKREMNTSALRRRFQQERKILASLEHPNIARLLDAGMTDDKIPYIAMEYVEGLPIDDFCNNHDSGLSERLDLFRVVCSTVDFAHRNLIVHRDLKPSNILVNSEGIPKLLDFGISKILSTEFENADSATVTKLGAMTPEYASPEQIKGESVTTATDIYSLGVILCELLSGHRPFEMQEGNLKEIYRAVIESDPPPPSSLVIVIVKTLREKTNAETKIKAIGVSESPTKIQNFQAETKSIKPRLTRPPTVNLSPQKLRGDLDNIVLKALKKEPERRYTSAANFSEDIRRHQKGLPVIARRDTFSYRAEKFIKRNGFLVVAGTLILLAVISGIIATLWQARIAQFERVKAERRFNDVRALANSFLFEFSPKIENLPGSTPARELLVKRALEYLDSLSQEAGNDLEIQRELAKAYEKVGDVQGNPSNPNLGDIKGALQSYEKSLSIRQKLFENEPNNIELQKDLAQNFGIIGDIQSNGGDYDKGEVFYEKALGMREQVLQQFPQDFEARSKLAKTVRSRGLIPFFDGDNKKALEYYNRARDIYEQLRGEKPGDDNIAEEYAYTYVLIGEAQDWDGELEIAGENLQKGLDMLLPLAARLPNNQSVRRSVMLAYSKRAENYEDTEQFNKAVISFGKAMEIAERTYQADPQNFQSKRDFALYHKKIAGALDSAGNSQSSLENLSVALKLFQEMCAADPNNNEYPYDLANTRFSIGETYLTLKNYELALETFQKAKEEFQAVLEKNPDNNFAVRMSSFNTNRIGKSYAALAAKGNRQHLRQKALDNFRAAFAGLNELKSTNNLSEIDDKELADMEKEIKETENKISK